MAPTKQEQEAQLTDLAETGDVRAVTSLLDQGVDVNGRHCADGCRLTALIRAAKSNRLDVITLLMQRGADVTLKDSENKTALDYARQSGYGEAVERIESMMQERNRDKVIYYTDIADRVREDIYDFAMKERLTLIRKSRYGDVESALITGFSAIEDQTDGSVLRKAFNEHVKRGGATEESAVFSGHIYKPRPGLPKA